MWTQPLVAVSPTHVTASWCKSRRTRVEITDPVQLSARLKKHVLPKAKAAPAPRKNTAPTGEGAACGFLGQVESAVANPAASSGSSGPGVREEGVREWMHSSREVGLREWTQLLLPQRARPGRENRARRRRTCHRRRRWPNHARRSPPPHLQNRGCGRDIASYVAPAEASNRSAPCATCIPKRYPSAPRRMCMVCALCFVCFVCFVLCVV
jgi:hypothetical protein